MGGNTPAVGKGTTKFVVIVKAAVIKRTRTTPTGPEVVKVTEGKRGVPDAEVEVVGLTAGKTDKDGRVALVIPDEQFLSDPDDPTSSVITRTRTVMVRKHHYGPPPAPDKPVALGQVETPAFVWEFGKGPVREVTPSTPPSDPDDQLFVLDTAKKPVEVTVRIADAGIDQPAPTPAVAAKDMDPKQAAAEVMRLHFAGTVTLVPHDKMSLDWLFQHFVDPTPHPTVPGKPANFLSPCDQRCVVIAPATDVTDNSMLHPARYNLKKAAPIGSVVYVDLADGPQKALPTATPPRVGKVFFDDSVPRQMDPRHIIATARFSAEVRAAVAGDIDLQVVYHVGLGTNNVDDCHGWGRALDFSGFSGRAPDRSTRVKRNVARVDTERNVIRVDINCFEETMTEDHFIVQFDWGDATPQPPAGTVASLPYRLAPSLAATTRAGRAARIFKAIYDTAKRHWRDTASGSNIGEQSAIMNPDHPTSNPRGKNGREAHQNHLHMQIGATGPTDTVPFDRFVTPAPPPPPPPPKP